MGFLTLWGPICLFLTFVSWYCPFNNTFATFSAQIFLPICGNNFFTRHEPNFYVQYFHIWFERNGKLHCPGSHHFSAGFVVMVPVMTNNFNNLFITERLNLSLRIRAYCMFTISAKIEALPFGRISFAISQHTVPYLQIGLGKKVPVFVLSHIVPSLQFRG
jgi:hypothetical protein